MHVEVRRPALELAPRRALGGAQRAGREVVDRQVVARRVAGLEHPQRPGGRRNAYLAVPHLDALVAGLDPRRAGVVPDRLLTRPRGLRDRARGHRQSRSTQRSTAHTIANARPGSAPSATSTVYLSFSVTHFWLIRTTSRPPLVTV